MKDDAEKVVEVMGAVIEAALASDKWTEKEVILLVRDKEGGWAFILPSQMTQADVSRALDDAFTKPPLMVGRKQEVPS